MKNNLRSIGNINKDLGIKPPQYDDEINTKVLSILEPHGRTSEVLLPIQTVDEKTGSYLFTQYKPIISKYKERLTRTVASANLSEEKVYLIERMFYASQDLQQLSEMYSDEGIDFAPAVNDLAAEIEMIAQYSKGKKGWAGELLQTHNINEHIHEQTEQRVHQAVEQEKQKKFILF